jgi:protein-tyrosine-phosphatase
MAQERGSSLRAVSRGTDPDAAVPPAVEQALRREGFDVGSFRPQALSEAELETALRVVAIGVEIPNTKPASRISRWDGIPAMSADSPASRAAIVSRLAALLDELDREAPRR